MKIEKTIFLALISTLLLLYGCVGKHHGEPSETTPESLPLVIYANIAGSGSVLSKADRGTEDNWSYTAFQDKDVMGFYSSGGNWLVDEGKGAFNNLALEYDANLKQFNDRTNGVEFSPTQMEGSKIYMYFPYCPTMDDPGIVLRIRDDDVIPSPVVGPLRCIDFLSSYKIELSGVVNGSTMALFGEFDHAFSELIIMRGEGFDAPPEGKERITAVLNEAYTHLRVDIDKEGSWTVNPTLYYNNENGLGLSEDDAKRWDAWHGENYSTTDQDPEGEPAWYIIVPTIGSEVYKKRPGPRSIVQYIEIFDNDGNMHQITSLRLSGGMTKYVDAGWRYPMKISMKEMVPTINPYPIEPWNPEDVNLTDQRTRGINSITEFMQWVDVYNTYIGSSDQDAFTETLLHYGDLYVDDSGNKSWHFYLLADLDLTQIPPDIKNQTCILPSLRDILDGQSTDMVDGKYRNHTISGLDRTFVGELSSANGKLSHIDFIEPKININSTLPIGILANTIDTASVDDCNVKDGYLINPEGPAGFVAGSMNGGSISNCTLSGFLISSTNGADDWNMIVGELPTGSYVLEGNDASDVVIPPMEP